MQRLENSGAKPSFLEIEVHGLKAGWDCAEAIYWSNIIEEVIQISSSI